MKLRDKLVEHWPGLAGTLRASCAIALALLALSALSPAGAQDSDNAADAARYSLCLSKAQNSPQDGETMARSWIAQNGGSAAGHCLAVSLIAQGRFEDAAERLEILAHAADETNKALRADLLGQAGQAWILADRLDRAMEAQTRGLDVDPDNLELLIDRGLTHASLEDYWSALDDFNRAYDLAPGRPDLLTYRATAYRYLDVGVLALDNVNQALGIDPDNPEALLERGILRHAEGDNEGARADWEKAVRVAPKSPAGRASAQKLRIHFRD
ncbi:MAG: tetratricopeptide repeat protein [Rhodovibrionaceae bacterium]|nr:tetratricopeptide repeat protein [Rhodovibrionaceae bacterium]